MKNKLTNKFIENLQAPASGRLEVFDVLLPGFGVRIGKANRPAFFVMYRVHGKQVRQTIGRYPATSLARARNDAMEALRLAGGGIDPVLESKRQNKSQFKPIAEEFLKRYAKEHQKPGTYASTKRHVETHLIPTWGHLPAKDITRAHVRVLLDLLMDTGKRTTANRVFATVSKLFNWCLECGYLETSPSMGMRAPAKEISRDRVLTLGEIRSIWKACDELAYPFGHWIQMMFATGGQRSGDVSNMQWSEIRGDWWEIAKPTKSETSHRVPLSKMALDLLDKVPRFEGDFAFSTRAGNIPISGYSKAKKLIDAKAEVNGWRFHDIRRTVATMFGEQLSFHPYVIERIQNRRSGTIKGVMKVYNRATYEKEMSEALMKWDEFLTTTINSDNVVQIHG